MRVCGYSPFVNNHRERGANIGNFIGILISAATFARMFASGAGVLAKALLRNPGV
jgi:hypothetical protein